MKFSAHVFVDTLRLNTYQNRHQIICPFHVDSRPSMSIDLEKATFYCYGACSEPKGGGPLQFVMKWARYIEKKPITPEQARKRLRHDPKSKDAKTQLIEILTKEVQLFCAYTAPRLADRCKEIERAIADVDAYVSDHPDDLDDEIWTLLATLHRELQSCEYGLALVIPRPTTYIGMLRHVSNTLPFYEECKRRGWWTITATAFELEIKRRAQQEHALIRQLEEQCHHANLFPPIQRTPIPRRTPIPIRTPIP